MRFLLTKHIPKMFQIFLSFVLIVFQSIWFLHWSTFDSSHTNIHSSFLQTTAYADSGEVLTGSVLSHDCSKLKCISLTFDDGPSKFTKKLLDALKKENIHVTFFVLGSRVDIYQDMLKKIHEAWHQIGNHTWNHKLLTKLTPEERASEIENTSQKIQEITGVLPNVFRPPYGWINDEILKEIPMAVIMWDIDTYDWKRKNVDTIIKNATTKVKRWDVILMHDAYQRSIDALPSLVHILKKRGFTFVTINELFWTGGLENGKKYSEKRN